MFRFKSKYRLKILYLLSTPTLEIPVKDSIEPFFMEILGSFARTQVEGGR
jgi:hypothetical protein